MKKNGFTLINPTSESKTKGFTLMNPTSEGKAKGFTLIELLVVISIIGILAALAMVSFTASQRQARDTARKSDLKQYQTALESFANQNSSLFPSRPDGSGATASTTLCADISMTTCPEDAKNATDNTYVYKYQSDGAASTGAATATSYVLWAKLENVTGYFLLCSNGKSGTMLQASLTVSSGNCPL